MADWKSKWKSAYSTKWNRRYWYNKEKITSWYNPNSYNKSEKEYNKLLEEYEANLQQCATQQAAAQCAAQQVAQEQFRKIKEVEKEIEKENKKRKSYNKDLIDCRKHFKIVVDKLTEENKRLTEENKRLKEKVSDLTKSFERERKMNKRIKETEIFKTVEYMDDLKQKNDNYDIRNDGRPSKNSVLL